MKKGWILLLTALLCVLLPVMAMAASGDVQVYVVFEDSDGTVADGFLVTNDLRCYEGPPASDESSYLWVNGNQITLHNFEARQIYLENVGASTENRTIVLEGSSVLNYTGGDPLVSEGVNLTITGSGKLKLLHAGGSCEGIDVTDGNLTIAGGDLTIQTSGHGIEVETEETSQASFTMTGGRVNITCEDDGLDVDEDILIAGGQLSIHSGDKGIDGGQNITISGGTVDVYTEGNTDMATSWGISASDALRITGGTVKVNSKHSSLEADLIEVSGGRGTVISRVDVAFACEEKAGLKPPRGERIVTYTGEYATHYTLADENGHPLRRYTWGYGSVPSTGDATPLFLLCVLIMASAGGIIILRRRSA